MRVLVTGGAKRIGAGIARRLALRGHDVAIHHHHAPDDAEALRSAIEAAGGRCCVVTGELADPATAPALIEAAREGLGGPVTGLVNNASLFAFDALPLTDFALLDSHMRVNLGAPIAIASAMASYGGWCGLFIAMSGFMAALVALPYLDAWLGARHAR